MIRPFRKARGAARRTVLIWSPAVEGGIPIHAHYQATELARRGIAVSMLCRAAHPAAGLARNYRQIHGLPPLKQGKGLASKIIRALQGIAEQWLFAAWIVALRPSVVLIEANTEYYGALWAWPHLALRGLGQCYVANFHDPVRAPLRGPRWFNRLSLWAAFRVYSGALLHGPAPAGAQIPATARRRIVPHGLFTHLLDHAPPYDLRQRLGIGPDAFVVLAFGVIMDRKNIDLLVRALPEVERMVLVVAGREVTTTQKPASAYVALAQELGVGDRLFMLNRFIPDEEVPALFIGCDAVALTYDAGFVSQSGVVQLAAQWNRQVIASAGESPLRQTVLDHGIGQFIAPDNLGALIEGLRQLQREPITDPAVFKAYRTTASWEANIDGLLGLLTEID